MPLTNLIAGFDTIPASISEAAGNLKFRNTILVYLEINTLELFEDNWLYIHNAEVRHGRITNFRNWSPELYSDKKTTILCLEYWTFDHEPLWNSTNDELFELARSEIRQLNLVPNNIEILRCHALKIPKCYPVYETGYRAHLNLLIEYLDQFDNLMAIGRYGSFKYNNQDHSILMGILAAKKIIDNSEIKLWDINTDSDYQEHETVNATNK